VQGREHVLSLNTAPLNQAAAWIVAQQQFWSQRLAALDRALERRRAAQAPHRRTRNGST